MGSLQSFISRYNRPMMAVRKIDNEFSLLTVSPEIHTLEVTVDETLLQSGEFFLFCQDIVEANKKITSLDHTKKIRREVFFLGHKLLLKGFLWEWDVLIIEIIVANLSTDHLSRSVHPVHEKKMERHEYKLIELESNIKLFRGLLDDMHDRFSTLESAVREHDFMLEKLEESIKKIEENDLLKFTQNLGIWKRAFVVCSIIALIVSPHIEIKQKTLETVIEHIK